MSDHTEATIRESSDNCSAGPDCRICRDVRPLLRLLDEARAERDALRKDAERYRYLRRGIDLTFSPEPIEVIHWRGSGPERCDGARLDRCVDAARAAKEQKP